MSDNTNTPFQIKNNMLVYCVLTSVGWIMACTVLYLLGKLTTSVVEAVGIIGLLIAVIGATWKVSVSKLLMPKQFYLRLALASLATVVLIGGVIYYAISNAYFSDFLSGLSPYYVTTSVNETHSPPLADKSYSRTIPFCDSNDGDLWRVSQLGTSLSCTATGLVMRQASVENYAEVLLNSYSADPPYGIRVNVAFQAPNDTNTWAGVIVQSPSEYAVAGGYIFKLNSLGQWQLQHILSNTNTVVMASGQVNINPKKPTAISVSVPFDGKLHCYVNNKQVFSWRDTLDNPPGAIGLIVAHAHGTSSSIVYSNFVPQGYGKP